MIVGADALNGALSVFIFALPKGNMKIMPVFVLFVVQKGGIIAYPKG
jgi:hypothetical protein